MKSFSFTRRGEPDHDAAGAFAARVYREELAFDLRSLPDVFFVLRSNGAVVGCIGCNHDLHCPLFRFDPRVREFLNGIWAGRTVIEQSVLAVSKSPIALPLLVSAVSSYAHYAGADGLLFAGIEVSTRTVSKLGFALERIGIADKRVIPPEELPNYELWFTLHDPILFLLRTDTAPEHCRAAFQKFGRGITVDPIAATVLGIDNS